MDAVVGTLPAWAAWTIVGSIAVATVFAVVAMVAFIAVALDDAARHKEQELTYAQTVSAPAVVPAPPKPLPHVPKPARTAPVLSKVPLPKVVTPRSGHFPLPAPPPPPPAAAPPARVGARAPQPTPYGNIADLKRGTGAPIVYSGLPSAPQTTTPYGDIASLQRGTAAARPAA